MTTALRPVIHDPAVRYLERVVPMALEVPSIPQALMEMYRHWVLTYMAYTDGGPDSQMWVPVGRVGPMLILGHSAPEDPEQCPMPAFPLWAFGLTKIPRPVHERLAAEVAKILNEEASIFSNAPAGFTQEPPAGLSNRRRVVEMLKEFPGARADLETVNTVLAGPETDDEAFLRALPVGWREAVLAIAEGYPVADLSGYIPSPELFAMVPDKFGQSHDLVPLGLVDSTLYVGCPTPPRGGSQASNITNSWKSARDASLSHVKLSMVLCRAGSRADIEMRQAVRVAKAPKPGATAAPFIRPSGGSSQIKIAYNLTKKQHDKPLSSPALSETDFIGVALYKTVIAGASDLHIETFEGSGCMRIRKDGTLRLLDGGRFGISRIPSLLQLLRNAMNKSGGSQEAYDGKLSIKVDDRFYDVRVSILPAPDASETSRGYAVLRFLPKDGKVRSLHDLRMSKDELQIVTETMEKPHGLVLMTGPTGSGKTTTLNAMISYLNEPRNLKILTAEDPIEYTIEGVQQIAITEQLTFAMFIRSALRQDPDVILIGEMRDAETAHAAIHAAQTGHLVFSTLHTNGAVETIQRLRGMGIPDYELESSLLTLISQRLIRKLCPTCKTQRRITDRETAVFAAHGASAPVILHEPKPGGCAHCDEGWSGRIPILELVKVTNKMKAAIKKGASESELLQICKEQGSRDLFAQSLLKAATGETSLGEAAQLNSGWE